MLKIGLSPTGITVGTRDIHYAWVIVGVASTLWTTSSAIRFAVPLLVSSFESDFGWSYGFIAFAFTLQWILSGLSAPLVGWLSDQYGVRRLLYIGAVLFIAGMLLTGAMTELWQFWLYFGLIMGGSMAIFQVTLVAGVPLWFKTKLGLAMGTVQALQGLGTALLILIVYILFTYLGLRWTFWIPGIVGGAILLLGIRYFHNEPAEIGIRRYGASKDEPIRSLQNNETARIRTRVFQRQAQKTSAFWNLIGIHFWGCAGHMIILLFLIAMIEDTGLSRGTGVAVYLTMNVVSTVTRFVVPVAADNFGSKGVMGASFVLQTLPVLMLMPFVPQAAWIFFVFAALYGIGMGGEMTAFPIINRQYYGDAPTGTTYGYQSLGGGLGMALGPLVGGFLWTLTDVYWPALVLSFVLSLFGAVSIYLLPNTSRQQVPDWEEQLPQEIRSSADQIRATGGLAPSLDPTGGDGGGS